VEAAEGLEDEGDHGHAMTRGHGIVEVVLAVGSRLSCAKGSLGSIDVASAGGMDNGDVKQVGVGA
jgi:hypothetical protein